MMATDGSTTPSRPDRETGNQPLLKVRQRWARERRLYRLLEMMPGLLVWTTLVGVLVLSFVRPLWAIVFIIVFDLYWLIRVVYVLVYILIAYVRFRRTLRVDWGAKIRRIRGWERLRHLVIIPTYKEPLAVLETTFASLARVNIPLNQLFVVLACEERDRAKAEENARAITERFGQTFGAFRVTFHPADIPGEIAGKGSNIVWAGRRAKELIDQRRIPYTDILVSVFDADTQVHQAYFSYLGYVFLKHPNRQRTSYQPIPVFHNNIWDSPALMRVVANSTTFWLMSETLRPDRLFTFASHSMPFQALVDVDFWQNDIVTEDSRIFLQCLVRYDGDYTVTPLYLPVSMDTVMGDSYWESLKNTYKQQQRWAYGVENFPYMVWNFVGNSRIPFTKKIKYLMNQLEGVYSWATAPMIIFILSWLPLATARDLVEATALGQNAPIVMGWLIRAAMIGLVFSAVISTIILPPRPPGVGRHHFLVMLLQWILFPYCMLIFGSFPATDAQTRLMLGRYMGYWVTPKARKGSAFQSPASQAVPSKG